MTRKKQYHFYKFLLNRFAIAPVRSIWIPHAFGPTEKIKDSIQCQRVVSRIIQDEETLRKLRVYNLKVMSLCHSFLYHVIFIFLNIKDISDFLPIAVLRLSLFWFMHIYTYVILCRTRYSIYCKVVLALSIWASLLITLTISFFLILFIYSLMNNVFPVWPRYILLHKHGISFTSENPDDSLTGIYP